MLYFKADNIAHFGNLCIVKLMHEIIRILLGILSYIFSRILYLRSSALAYDYLCPLFEKWIIFLLFILIGRESIYPEKKLKKPWNGNWGPWY